MAQNMPSTNELQSRRRRALFPNDENSTTNNGLGPISPIKFDSESEDEEYISLIRKQVDLFSLKQMDNDYDIFDVTNNLESTPNSHKSYPNSETMSPLILSPNVSKDSLTLGVDSPSNQMKTPHELSDNSKIPKLIRKSSLDTNLNEFINSPEDNGNLQQNQTKNSKVRTALFPDTFQVPSKCFYSKIGLKKSPITEPKLIPNKNKSTSSQPIFLCSRKRNSGEINAGVRHKIKKPKIKKIDKNHFIKAAMDNNLSLNNCLNRSKNCEDKVLKEYLNDLNEIHKVPKLIIDNPINKESRKRPHSPELSKENVEIKKRALSPSYFDNKKFFKSKPTSNNLNKSLCDLTSDLAINSPKKPQEKKLFSIFYPNNKVNVDQKMKSPKGPNPIKKFRKLSESQMLLDAGQKRFGVTQCTKCKIIYHMGDPSDEIMHLNFHDASNVFRFNGWKNERVVSKIEEHTKIIQIVPNDPKPWWKKVKEIIEVVNRDLGFYEIRYNTENSQIFLYSKNKTIIGVLVAEPKITGYKLLTGHDVDQIDMCSEESYSIKCGISRIWVHKNYRKQGVASALMNSLKKNFIFGYILKNEDIAFSSPTEMGKIFGKNYFKTPNFLIYY